MENYIITEKTIALQKIDKKTIIYDVDKIRVINKNIKKVLNDNCIFYGSSIAGRKASSKNILNIKYKPPINISDDNNYILIQTNSLRCSQCLFLMINKIIDYQEDNKTLNVTCVNNCIFKIDISRKSFERMLINSIRLNNILQWRKKLNIV